MPDNGELFARALVDAANGNVHSPFRSRETAEAYLAQVYTVFHDIGDIYPKGCAGQLATRMQALSGHPSVTVEEIAQCQTLDELRELLKVT